MVSACRFLVSNWSVDSLCKYCHVTCVVFNYNLPLSAVTFGKGRKRLEKLDSTYKIFVRG